MLPKATTNWALDSGAFTELYAHGKWRISASEYANLVDRYSSSIGKMNWASIQDWLCTPIVLAKTGLTIKQHQIKTLKNYIAMRSIKPEIKWIPVLQGWTVESYLNHLDMYNAEGFELQNQPLVGVGSLANRQDSPVVGDILRELSQRGLNIHAFGLSSTGLLGSHQLLKSSDSMAWSFIARKRKIKLTRCGANHRVCNNCFLYAKKWRREVLSTLRRSKA